MSKYLDTLLKIKNGKYGSECLPELERIEQFVKGNITSQELIQNADNIMKYIIYHTLNKIINYEEKDVRYYIELPSDIFFNTTMPYCIFASKVEDLGYNLNITKNIGPKYISKYYPNFHEAHDYNGKYYMEIVGDFSQFPKGVMLFRSDWFRIISKYPNLVEKLHYLTINNYELKEKFRHISLEEIQQRVNSEILYQISVPKDGEPQIHWNGKEEAKYLPQEVIDSIKFVIPKEYVTMQQVSDGQFGTFEEILNGLNLLESSQTKKFFSKSDINDKIYDKIIVGGIDMEKANKRIIYEAVLVHTAYINERDAGFGNNEYSEYHSQNSEWYDSFGSRFNQILGFTGQTIDEFANYVATVNLTQEQRRALAELRREPMFKRLMGEVALQQKEELENVLGVKITSSGMTFADENGPKVATKTEQQLDQELNAYTDRLAELFSSSAITEEQYDSYEQNLDYIYDYYISCSRGEQIPFRRLTNAQYEKIREKAMENGIEFSEQLAKETTDLRYDHEELQELQNRGIKR